MVFSTTDAAECAIWWIGSSVLFSAPARHRPVRPHPAGVAISGADRCEFSLGRSALTTVVRTPAGHRAVVFGLATMRMSDAYGHKIVFPWVVSCLFSRAPTNDRPACPESAVVLPAHGDRCVGLPFNGVIANGYLYCRHRSRGRLNLHGSLALVFLLRWTSPASVL